MSEEIPNFIDIAPECFTDGNYISYKGENYYRACNAFVANNADGGQSFCVKRVNHPGMIHEAYDGRWKLSTCKTAHPSNYAKSKEDTDD